MLDRYGRLVVPKGHMEEKETKEDAALREVSEETGYKGIKIIKPLIVEKLNYQLFGQSHCKIIHNFLFELFGEETPKPEYEPQEIYKLVWVDLDSAIKKAHFENTKTLLKSVKKFYDERRGV